MAVRGKVLQVSAQNADSINYRDDCRAPESKCMTDRWGY